MIWSCSTLGPSNSEKEDLTQFGNQPAFSPSFINKGTVQGNAYHSRSFKIAGSGNHSLISHQDVCHYIKYRFIGHFGILK